MSEENTPTEEAVLSIKTRPRSAETKQLLDAFWADKTGQPDLMGQLSQRADQTRTRHSRLVRHHPEIFKRRRRHRQHRPAGAAHNHLRSVGPRPPPDLHRPLPPLATS